MLLVLWFSNNKKYVNDTRPDNEMCIPKLVNTAQLNFKSKIEDCRPHRGHDDNHNNDNHNTYNQVKLCVSKFAFSTCRRFNFLIHIRNNLDNRKIRIKYGGSG